jgi:hypothetical protein
MAIVQIQPVQGFGYTADYLLVYTLSYQLDNLKSGLQLYYAFLDNKKMTIKDGNLYYTEEEISGWGTDDDYILNKVAKTLNVTIIPNTQEP